jgi:hypothetical protein
MGEAPETQRSKLVVRALMTAEEDGVDLQAAER